MASKLVRDHVGRRILHEDPKAIRDAWKRGPDELDKLYREKIYEEVDELLTAEKREDILSEAADVREAVVAYVQNNLQFVTAEEILAVAEAKRITHGGYEKEMEWMY